MGKPLISVYMTVKNGSRWIRCAVESIRAQTFQEWELVIVDDGSTDDTLLIIGTYAKYDSRIKVISTEGIGRSAALNLALAHCQAKYVANLDADDLAHPRRLEIQHRLASAHPEFSMLSSKSILLEEGEFFEWPVIEKYSLNVRDITKILAYYNPINHSSVFAKREALIAVGSYNQSLKRQIDYDMWVRLASAGYRIGQVNLPLAAKRWHNNQSFEAKSHLVYVINSLGIQVKAIMNMRPVSLAWIFLLGRFGWSMLPRHLRYFARRGRCVK